MAVLIGCWATDTGAEIVQMWVREDRSLRSGRRLPKSVDAYDTALPPARGL